MQIIFKIMIFSIVSMLQIDGSHNEGGGSIVRVALALSTLTQKPFEIKSIRSNRPNPGLKNQHLFCIKALEKLCNAKTENAFLGSTYLKFYSGKIEGKTIDIDIETAGSISLFLQSILLPSMLANKPVKLNITGGTDAKWAAPIDYFKELLLPQLRKYADIECNLLRRGYYPKGNGKVEIKIKPKYKISDFNSFEELRANLKANAPKINLTNQHNLMQIKGISHASLTLQDANVAERQAKVAELVLNKLNCPINIQSEYCNALSTGSGITLWAIFSKNKEDIDFHNPIRLGADALGEKGKKAEQVGIEAANSLLKEINSKSPVDEHLADQILPFMALFSGKIKTSSITGHTRTNIYAIEKFLGKIFEIDEQEKIISTID